MRLRTTEEILASLSMERWQVLDIRAVLNRWCQQMILERQRLGLQPPKGR